MKKVFWLIIGVTVALMAVAVVLMIIYTDNKTIGITQYDISHPEIPAGFEGYRIAQIADLHNTEFGEDNKDLLNLLTESKPDIIVFTGDQLDARKTDKDVVLRLVEQTVQIAPCYLVTGNHEGSIPGMDQFHTELEAIGVVVLEEERIELSSNGDTIDLVGLNEATRNKRYYTHGAKVSLETSLQELNLNKERYAILLAHRPDFLYVYERNHIDLALCGHIHGGQIRINGQGLVDPSKKLFPKYDAGLYTLDDATMVLSRGLGNSLFPWRINNPPELVIVELHSEQ